jgi:hypothetical protein
MVCILHPVISDFDAAAHTVTLEEKTLFCPYTFSKSATPHMSAGHFKTANQNCQDVVG